MCMDGHAGVEYIEIAAQCKAMAAEQSKLVGKMRDLSEIVAAQVGNRVFSIEWRLIACCFAPRARLLQHR